MASSSSATVAVEKATSDLLIGPDWTMNIDICDSVNSHRWQAKDVVKAVKKRLQHKNSKVQLLSLTLLETMVKNCGDYVHFQIAEKNILGEMVKIVKKKSDMHVRDKILVLLDAWQEAFGGPGGKHPHYYWAYEELRRSGVQFPKRSLDTSPIFTPPASHPTLRITEPGYGMPTNSSRRLDETMATKIEGLSLSSMDAMRNVMELLNDMLQAVNPSDRSAVKDEIIADVVDRCRSNQKMLMQMLTTTSDEELLCRGLELNDSMQIVLAKHDAIASGSPMPSQVTNLRPQQTEFCESSVKHGEPSDFSPRSNANPSPPAVNMTRSQIDEDEEEEDDFAQLARRHSKGQPKRSASTSAGTNDGLALIDNSSTSSVPGASSPVSDHALALALPDPPASVRTTTKEQDMIDLLSLALATTSPSSHTPHSPSASNGNTHQVPVSSSTQELPFASQNFSGNQGHVPYNSYVVPWAQPQPQQQFQPQAQSPFQLQQQFELQSRSGLQRPQQPQFQSPSQVPQYSSQYPPPPWAATPGYANNQSHLAATNNSMFSTPRTNAAMASTTMQAARPLQHFNSFSSRGSNGLAAHGDPQMSSGLRNPAPTVIQKPFIPSYRLFEDLNVLGSADGRLKMTSTNTTPSMSGTSSQGMVAGRK
ncbi:TOM1-like protein 2 [Tripterygium wilfordii]|uniref:TOM1-like protein 2 n=1 Tax=Tripterygium wilfordii TaxID=458696 RepID=A0A7J7DWJ7_TRIWF|nr:TOM1-like protein 6 [Tripterygium wilfordii]KAF5750758.1 TOM1-like protein 2 [Tripterygium wilfordii]